ncbi:stage VI sporulation protein F [Pueribacillus sp. YX66]|uniref:stage VI sporulation protein F n=1 Tax=Pueribacillus sp. YX66 TaxID=3229242 RepID=UPI00358D65CD
MSQNLFDNIEKRTNVKKEDILKLANSVSKADLKDERTLRNLIADVSRLANVPVSKEKENKIVQAILNNNMPADLSQLTNMIKKK